VTQNVTVMWVGLGIFLTSEIASVVEMYFSARFYREGRDEKWNKEKSTSEKWVETTWDWLPSFGLVLIVVAAASKNETIGMFGITLYFCRIVSYFIMGLIAEYVAGIPQRMTYGGWKIDRYRGRYRRRR
jgi:hypothetical protein